VRKIILRPEVLADIQEIWVWISKDNRVAADRIEADIYLRIDKLAEVPGAGHRRSDVPDARVLFVNVPPYSIAYKYDEDSVTIIRVLHGARDFRTEFPNPT
jgi:plasmid stabilization system protein ParE